MTGDVGFRMVAMKRRWVPEWLWRALGQLPVRQPFRWMLTKPWQWGPRLVRTRGASR